MTAVAAGRDRRKSRLGRYIQGLRERQVPRMIPERAAELAMCRRETITRVENGTALPSPVLLGSLLRIYEATDDERAEAVRLREYAAQDTRMIEHAADLPAHYLAFRRDESDAVEERTMDHVAIPGLLQTAGYAAAVAEAAHWLLRGTDWEQRAASERRSRQRLLEGSHPILLRALIAEGVLYTCVGSPATMVEQLRHLLTMGEQPNVTIQVVPRSVGAWGTFSGPAIILDFDDPRDEHGSVYLEHAAGGETVETEQDVTAIVSLFEHAEASLALSPQESAEAIKTALRALGES